MNDSMCIVSTILSLAVLGMCIAVYVKINKQKETYCVDISGGFAAPCNCTGM